ncbi:O-methyltransferase [Rhodospirillum sp. A1_3_36]|uniref:O-methyltransferase n=1 Tax=Rhodospirillum sp. A1_3_36 TaxID=3391666 RepID=UPI0039A77FA7
MTTLTSSPVAPLLTHLLAKARESDATLRDRLRSRSTAESAALAGGEDYRSLYAQAKDLYLAVSPETGRLLYMLVRATGARSVIEFGTSFGVSTLHIAAALRDNGGGRVIGSEFEPSKTAKARETMEAAGLADLVEIRQGDALETLARDLPNRVDLLVLDGAKALYPRILSQVEGQLAPHALIVADNAGDSPAYLARVRDPDGGYLSVPLTGDVELSLRLG